MPPKVQRSNARHYRSATITEVKEFDGRAHLLPSQDGWQEVADYALDWALANAGRTGRDVWRASAALRDGCTVVAGRCTGCGWSPAACSNTRTSSAGGSARPAAQPAVR
jgi:hypothetical protein